MPQVETFAAFFVRFRGTIILKNIKFNLIKILFQFVIITNIFDYLPFVSVLMFSQKGIKFDFLNEIV